MNTTSELRRSFEVPDDEPDYSQERPEQPLDLDEEQNKDEKNTHNDDGGRLYCWLSLCVLLVGVTIIVIMLVVVKDDNDDSSNNNAIGTPAPAPTVAPTPPPITEQRDPQKRLDILVEAVGKNPATADFLTTLPLPLVPTSSIKLVGTADNYNADPISRAASWVTRSDFYWAEHEIVGRFVLAALYYSNAGEDWIIKTNWLTETSYCNWWGVTCCHSFHSDSDPHQCADKEGHALIELDLHENNLQGEITAALALLEDCHILWLSGNDLTGELDPFIFANMRNLDALYIQRNRLTGHIDGTIRDNGKLDTLYTHGNAFSGNWPETFCPTCVNEGLCDFPPMAYSLNCDAMKCPPACCASVERAHCINGVSDEDEED